MREKKAYLNLICARVYMASKLTRNRQNASLCSAKCFYLSTKACFKAA